MSTFNDKNDQAWNIELTVGSIKRIKTLAKIDLLQVAEQESQTLAMLYEDPMTLVDVLYVACKDEADAREISDEDFGSMFNGEAIEAAAEALIEALLDFFPPRRRVLLAKAMSKMREVEVAAIEKIGKEMDEVVVDEIVEKAYAEMKSGN